MYLTAARSERCLKGSSSRSTFQELFKDILNPKQLEGLRLLLTPMAQAQFNATTERRTDRPHRGVTCFDCHVNGHTNAATHLVGDIRPQEHRHRIDVPTLRGVNVQRIFGSQRAMKSVEDFTEFEQRAAYFDGDPVDAQKKGVTILERGSQVHFMAEVQDIIDFPPAPKLNVLGKLDPKTANEQGLRGQALFHGKLNVPSAIRQRTTRTVRYNLHKAILKEQMINGARRRRMGRSRRSVYGIKDSPPFARWSLLTLEMRWSSSAIHKRGRDGEAGSIGSKSCGAKGAHIKRCSGTALRARLSKLRIASG